MRVLLEILRIIIIFVFIGGIGYLAISGIYKINKNVEAYSWLGALAIYLLLFIIYKNKWQFTGFYKGKGREKLQKRTSMTLIGVSLILMVSPFVMGTLLG